MSFRYYKRVNLGGGVHLNLSKTGVGVSAGIPGARYSVHSSGRTTRTVGLPGTGVYYRKDNQAKKGTTGRQPLSRSRGVSPAVVTFPKAGLFAPKQDKAFVRGVTLYMQGKHGEALGLFQNVATLDDGGAHVGEELFAAVCLVALGRLSEAVPYLQTVMASDEPIPDALMTKHHVGGQIAVQITPEIEAVLPMSSLSAALLLAEVYQHTDQPQVAIELLESLGSLTAHPECALSLAELFIRAGQADDVLRVSEGFISNTDDLTAQLLIFRALALADKALPDAALATLKEAMRFRSRDARVLREARYVRALVYEQAGRKSQSRKDLERIYAEDPHYLDVAARLDMAGESTPERPDGGQQ